MKKHNKKGFTMAELLIVVAIIALLVAIALPMYSAELEKSKEATDVANLRAAYAQAAYRMMKDGGTAAHSDPVQMVQSDGEWTTDLKNSTIAGIKIEDIEFSEGCKLVCYVNEAGEATKITFEEDN